MSKEKDPNKDEEKAFELGYGKPPVHTRFSSENQPENRGSRKGVKNFSTAAREMLDKIAREQGLDGMDLIASRLIKLALLDNIDGIPVSHRMRFQAIRELLHRMEGRPTQAIVVGENNLIEADVRWIMGDAATDNQEGSGGNNYGIEEAQVDD